MVDGCSKLADTLAACAQVSLFNYPVVIKHAPALRYGGHSSHVMNVRWSADEKFAISVGGRDRWGDSDSALPLGAEQGCAPSRSVLGCAGPRAQVHFPVAHRAGEQTAGPFLRQAASGGAGQAGPGVQDDGRLTDAAAAAVRVACGAWAVGQRVAAARGRAAHAGAGAGEQRARVGWRLRASGGTVTRLSGEGARTARALKL